MNILLVGSGGREHVLLSKIKESTLSEKIYIAPGNAGMRGMGKTVDIAVDDIDGLVQFAVENKIGLVVVGPELPLCLGITDAMNEAGIKVFGPSKEAARLEGSKIYAKEFMEKYSIPTAKYMSFSSSQEAIDALIEFEMPVVIKADGLAAGKGVVIAKTREEAVTAIKGMIDDKKFGDSSANIILEEYLDGIEASQLCFVDGETIIPLDSVQDYKREKDNDEGENTGGMGTYSPSRFMNEKTKKYVFDEVLMPFVRGLKTEKLVYRGLIFIGLMIKDDKAKVVEFNVRFGDPEAQSLLMRLDTDLLYLMKMTTEENLRNVNIKWSNEAAVCVVLASEGYPRKSMTGRVIRGLDKLEDVRVFHSATELRDGEYYSTGGRVLSVVATGMTVEEAREKAYREIEKIELEGSHYRSDIAK